MHTNFHRSKKSKLQPTLQRQAQNPAPPPSHKKNAFKKMQPKHIHSIFRFFLKKTTKYCFAVPKKITSFASKLVCLPRAELVTFLFESFQKTPLLIPVLVFSPDPHPCYPSRSRVCCSPYEKRYISQHPPYISRHDKKHARENKYRKTLSRPQKCNPKQTKQNKTTQNNDQPTPLPIQPRSSKIAPPDRLCSWSAGTRSLPLLLFYLPPLFWFVSLSLSLSLAVGLFRRRFVRSHSLSLSLSSFARLTKRL